MIPSVAPPPAPTSTDLGPCFPPEHLYYLASGFPAASLTVDNLRRILLAHDVELPTGAKRSYVRAFDDFVFGNRGGILSAHAEKRRPRPVKTQGIAPAERDNHLTAAFLGAEWFYLAPGFDVRILTGHEIQQIIEKHGLDRDRRVWKKAELVTLFERSVVVIRHTVVRKQVQTAGNFQRNHDINDIVNWEDSDEGDRSELADTPPSSMSWDQHDLRSDAAAVDDAKADDDGDKGGKAEPELDTGNLGVRSPAAWATPRKVPQSTTTYPPLQPKGRAKINLETMGTGTARRPDVSQSVQKSKAESTNSQGLPQKIADVEALTAPMTESATTCKSTHTSGPLNATHAFTRSTCAGNCSDASLPAASLAATYPPPLQYVKQVEDLTHMTSKAESTNSKGLPQNQADGEALTAPLTASATKCRSAPDSGPLYTPHAFSRSTCDGSCSNASLPTASPATSSLAATHPLPLQYVTQVEDLTRRIGTLEVALEQQLGALVQRVNGIEHQVGHMASQINPPYPSSRIDGIERQVGALAPQTNIPYPGNRVDGLERQVGHLASQINMPCPSSRIDGIEQQVRQLAPQINIPSPGCIQYPGNLGVQSIGGPQMYAQPSYGMPQTATYTDPTTTLDQFPSLLD